jgi:riboflavin synthase
VGKILSIGGGHVEVVCSFDDLSLGNSVAVNGVCLTVTAFSNCSFRADLSEETIHRSSLKNLRTSSPVNLERALKLGGRLGGHIVQGHVDAVSKVLNIQNNGVITFETPDVIKAFVAEKGSIAIDGVSLTVSKDLAYAFEVAVIPHTFMNTNLCKLGVHSIVNLEADPIARYVQKLAAVNNQGKLLKELIMEFDV